MVQPRSAFLRQGKNLQGGKEDTKRQQPPQTENEISFKIQIMCNRIRPAELAAVHPVDPNGLGSPAWLPAQSNALAVSGGLDEDRVRIAL